MGNQQSIKARDRYGEGRTIKNTDKGPWVMATYRPKAENISLAWNEKFQVYTNYPDTVKDLDFEPLPPKKEIEYNVSQLRDVHMMCKSISIANDKTVYKLVEDLINQGLRTSLVGSTMDKKLTDADKVRLLYYWFTSQDVKHSEYPLSSNHFSIHYQLRQLKEKHTTYAVLFALMCSYAGVPCVILKGCVKGGNHDPGVKLKDKYIREWNAVLVDGQWQFVDTFWGSSISLSPATCWSGTDPWYLFPDPEELKYSHFPDTCTWQLLDNPMTRNEFEAQVYLRKHFFEMKMGVIFNPCEQIECNAGEVDILFQLHSDGVECQEFRCITSQYMDAKKKWEVKQLPDKNLQLDFVQKQVEYESNDLKGEVIHRPTTRGSNIPKSNLTARDIFIETDDDLAESVHALSVKVRFPERGIYKLEIVGRSSEEEEYDWIAIYRVVVKKCPDWDVFFPRMENIGWGPNQYLKQCGLEAVSHKNGEIRGKVGDTLYMKLRILENAPTRRISLQYRMRLNQTGSLDDPSETKELPQSFEQSVENGITVLTMPILMETIGELILNVKAILNEDEKGNVINYRVVCEKDPREAIEAKIKESISQLDDAISRKEIDVLDRAIMFTRTNGVKAEKEVVPWFKKAEVMNRELKKWRDYSAAIPNITNRLLSTLRTFANPDNHIVRVTRATFVLLGDDRKELATWQDMLPKLTSLGDNNVRRRVEQFDINSVTPQLVAEVKRALGRDIHLGQIASVNKDVAAFAKWIDKVISMRE